MFWRRQAGVNMKKATRQCGRAGYRNHNGLNSAGPGSSVWRESGWQTTQSTARTGPCAGSGTRQERHSMSRIYPGVSLIGAPTDVGAGHRGARLGPEALRIAGIGEALVKRGVDVIDRGNLDGPRNPWQKPVEGYRHLAEVVAWNRAVMD